MSILTHLQPLRASTSISPASASNGDSSRSGTNTAAFQSPDGRPLQPSQHAGPSAHSIYHTHPGNPGHGDGGEQHRDKRGVSSERADDSLSGDEGQRGGGKKQKFSRSRTACLQCRSRKSKCGALPPNPCPNCIEAELDCVWPVEDGRSSKARLQRSRSSQSRRSGGNGFGADTRLDTSGGTGPTMMMDEGWLDRLLAAGSLPASEGGSNNGYQHSLPTSSGNYSLNPSNLGTVLSTRAPPYPSFASPSTSLQPNLPLPSFESLFPTHNSSLLPSAAVDPAQFIWAVSSRLPTVEESSPNDERASSMSGASGVSPAVAEAGAVQIRSERAIAAAAAGGGTLGAVKSSTKAARGGHKPPDGKIVKVTWWRPHGQTAIAPGLKRITLKVRVETPQDAYGAASSPHLSLAGPGGLNEPPQELIGADGMPSTQIMRHLLDVFSIHFGAQFPFLDKMSLESKIEEGTASLFLLNCIAATAARFSTHPAIALPSLQPHAYGNVFNSRAKALLGSMLAVPSRETVAGFILLAHTGFANDSESEVWMFTGMAVRMAIDLGLHLNPPEESNISADERRQNRLVFWSVLLMDYALAFGVGRQTAFRIDDITQPIPTEEDISPPSPNPPITASGDPPRSPFPFAAKQMILYGPLINILNGGGEASASSSAGGAVTGGSGGNAGEADTTRADRAILAARAAAIKEYNCLPGDMQWNVMNLQRHNRANQGSAFLHLHLWMHTILASAFLTGSNLLRRNSNKLSYASGGRSGAATPNSSTASNLWRNSARTIGDILVLSDIINPNAYFALPFVNQAFFVAGCCYVKEIEQHSKSTYASPVTSPRLKPASLTMTGLDPPQIVEPPSSPPPGAISSTTNPTAPSRQVDLSRALLTSVATTNISTLQQGLAKMTTYWSGVAWVAGALAQRIEGIQDVDLASLSEKLASFVSLPDKGLVDRVAGVGMGSRGGMGVGGEKEEQGGEGGLKMTRGLTEDVAMSPMSMMAFGQNGGSLTPGPMGGVQDAHIDFSDLDFLSLPFDLGSVEGGSQNVTEQDVPLPPSLHPEWFR